MALSSGEVAYWVLDGPASVPEDCARVDLDDGPDPARLDALTRCVVVVPSDFDPAMSGRLLDYLAERQFEHVLVDLPEEVRLALQAAIRRADPTARVAVSERPLQEVLASSHAPSPGDWPGAGPRRPRLPLLPRPWLPPGTEEAEARALLQPWEAGPVPPGDDARRYSRLLAGFPDVADQDQKDSLLASLLAPRAPAWLSADAAPDAEVDACLARADAEAREDLVLLARASLFWEVPRQVGSRDRLDEAQLRARFEERSWSWIPRRWTPAGPVVRLTRAQAARVLSRVKPPGGSPAVLDFLERLHEPDPRALALTVRVAWELLALDLESTDRWPGWSSPWSKRAEAALAKIPVRLRVGCSMLHLEAIRCLRLARARKDGLERRHLLAKARHAIEKASWTHSGDRSGLSHPGRLATTRGVILDRLADLEAEPSEKERMLREAAQALERAWGRRPHDPFVRIALARVRLRLAATRREQGSSVRKARAHSFDPVDPFTLADVLRLLSEEADRDQPRSGQRLRWPRELDEVVRLLDGWLPNAPPARHVTSWHEPCALVVERLASQRPRAPDVHQEGRHRWRMPIGDVLLEAESLRLQGLTADAVQLLEDALRGPPRDPGESADAHVEVDELRLVRSTDSPWLVRRLAELLGDDPTRWRERLGWLRFLERHGGALARSVDEEFLLAADTWEEEEGALEGKPGPTLAPGPAWPHSSYYFHWLTKRSAWLDVNPSCLRRVSDESSDGQAWLAPWGLWTPSTQPVLAAPLGRSSRSRDAQRYARWRDHVRTRLRESSQVDRMRLEEDLGRLEADLPLASLPAKSGWDSSNLHELEKLRLRARQHHLEIRALDRVWRELLEAPDPTSDLWRRAQEAREQLDGRYRQARLVVDKGLAALRGVQQDKPPVGEEQKRPAAAASARLEAAASARLEQEGPPDGAPPDRSGAPKVETTDGGQPRVGKGKGEGKAGKPGRRGKPPARSARRAPRPAGGRGRARREARLELEALSIEGGLLTPEWLSKVAQLAAGQQGDADYRIPRGCSLRDEIGRYWRIAQALWADFAAGQAAGAEPWALATRFVTGLLRDVLGFASLTPVAPVELAERPYPIGHAAQSGRVPVVIAAPLAEAPGAGLDAPHARLGDGGRRRSAFGLAQEYLNASEQAVWGLASDGLCLRLVRDNASLTRPAWVQADLARIFLEGRYADFAALWLLAHETRFGAPGAPGADCPLEAWRLSGREEGTRAREQLRGGVEAALLALGQSFLAHPDNGALRAALAAGELTPEGYFQQLLRLVYRLIFVLAVEERDLLHPRGTPEAARALYARGYGLRRLRDRALRRAAHDRHGDLWEATKVALRGLAAGEPRLGLPALAGLFAPGQCPALDAARLTNAALLLAVFRLAWLREPAGLARVNWRDMGPEELGSVYESLLELVPQVRLEARGFAFAGGDEARGNARKKTGSYYTPDSLVQVLLDSALEPVVRATVAAHPDRPADALLGLAVVDPACGSGHFLLAAARRLAAHVARLEAQGTPSTDDYRAALRRVVGRCLFGVDVNPLAVELCKVSLWMEALEPGRPLTFLDSHVRLGNALLGATPALMAGGVPDAAWTALEGDDKRVATALRRRNRTAAEGQAELWPAGADPAAQVAAAVAAVERAPDTDVAALAGKETSWSDLLGSAAYRHEKLVADAWCAAFVWPKAPGPLEHLAPTNDLWWRLRDRAARPDPALVAEVERLAAEYRFFHWHLAFPQVFARGGFDVVLGNPPWERVKLQEQEFFASRDDEIAGAPNAAARKRLIAELPRTNPGLWRAWCAASREAEGQSHLIRSSGRYPLCGRGDVNTYAVFAEHMRSVLGPTGAAGCVLPAGIATDDTTKEFFQSLVAGQSLATLFHFENEDLLFPSVTNKFRFVVLSVRGPQARIPVAEVAAFARSPVDLLGPGRRYRLSAEEIAAVNPNTRTLPTFTSRRDADLNLRLYRQAGVLWRESDPDGNPWGLRFMAMLHMANDSGLFRTAEALEADGWRPDGNEHRRGDERMLPLYEAKLIHHFDHRFGTFEGATEANRNKGTLPQATDAQHADPGFRATPQYWVAEGEVEARLRDRWPRGWLLGWRDITNAHNERTVIAAVIPRVAVNDVFLLMLPAEEPARVACLVANLSSLSLDYPARQKVGGSHLKYFVMRQLPVLPPSRYDARAPWGGGESLAAWLLPRVLELTYTAHDLEPFARDCGYAGPPFRWDPARRRQLRAELDAAFFHLYGLDRDDTAYVLDTFPVVRKNEEKEHGEFLTRRLVLEAYDALARARETGTPYRSPVFEAGPGA